MIPLEPRTQYEVRVGAKNGEGDTTNWSSVGRGTTGPSNSRPEFDRSGSVIELRVDENTRAGQNLGSAISASDADSNSLTYTLEGPGKDSFTIVSSSGQIRTRSALDHETRDSYSLTVKVDDRQSKDNSIAAKSVTVMVDDVREPPSAPAAPTVAGIPGSTSSVRVTWDEPANTGPQIDRGTMCTTAKFGEGWGRWSHTSADRSTIITGLKAGTRYEAQVRARSDEGTGEWSRAGSGMPNPDVANRVPAFSGGVTHVEHSGEHPAEHGHRRPDRGDRPRRRYADLHHGRNRRGLVRHPFDLRRRPDTDKRGAELRGEVELLRDGASDGRQRRYRRGQRDDQGDGRGRRSSCYTAGTDCYAGIEHELAG